MNKLLTLKTVQEITGGQWITVPKDDSKTIIGGAFDTRALGDAQVFFAWKGEASDGHLYIGQLEASGIELIIVEREVDAVGDKAILLVQDSMKALHQMAAELIRGFSGKIVNITGSSGKTTTKTWLKHIVGDNLNFLTNVGSFNNHIGCPITIMNLTEEHEVLALEMGTSGLGEIELLTSIAPADIAVLLNVGHAHLGKLGSLEATYQAKLEIFSHTKKNAIGLVPFNDIKLKNLLPEGVFQTFGENSPDFSFRRIKTDPIERTQTLEFNSPYGLKTITVNRLGDFVGSLLAAVLGIVHHLGLKWEQIESNLACLPSEKGRSIFLKGQNDSLILDDTYNANPQSVVEMLKTICQLNGKQTVGVIGNLAELEEGLGSSAGYIIDNLPEGLTRLVLTGETGSTLKEKIAEKHPNLSISYFDSPKQIIDHLKSILEPGMVIGVKGSRTSHMERIVYALTGEAINCDLARCGKLLACLQCDQL